MENNFSGILIKRIPILRPLVSLMLGIAIQIYFNVPPIYFFGIAIVASIILLSSLFLSHKQPLFYKRSNAFTVITLFTTIGCLLSFTHNKKNEALWIGNYYNQGIPILLTLQEPPIIKEKSIKVLAKAEAVLINHQWQNVEGNVMVYINKDAFKTQMQYGSQILVTGSLLPIEFSGNPAEFNYSAYCANKNIFYQTFLSTNDFKLLNTSKAQFPYTYIYKSRNAILSILRTNIYSPAELSVAEALLVGYRNDLDKELIHAYSNTGVIHIIVIAGLHLGMIYSLLILLFSPFKNKKWCRIFKPIITLIVLWGFCLITGANTPILRSTVMFTFILLGEIMGKRTNSYNSLALSAFCILLIDPFSLMEASFQFSYSAVLGIIIFSHRINLWVTFQNKLLRFIWSICSVTLSAQILTLPLIIFYFHRIPTLFIVTNILAVPLAGLILYTEIFLILISSIPIMAHFIGKILEILIGSMNTFITNINGLPFSGWENLQLSVVEVITLFAFILSMAAFLFLKKNQMFILGLLSLLCFTIIRSIDLIKSERQQQIIIYNIKQHSAIDIVCGRNYYFIGDSILQENGFLKDFHLSPSRIFNRTTETDDIKGIYIHNNIITSSNKSICLIDKEIDCNSHFNTKQSIDAIIIKNNVAIELRTLASLFNCHLYILDASNSRKRISTWKLEADSLSLPYYSVADKGAFIMDL